MNNNDNSRIKLVRENQTAQDNPRTTFWIVVAVLVTLILSRTDVLTNLLAFTQALLGWYTLGMVLLLILMITGHVNNWVGKMLYTICSPLLKLVYKFNPAKNSEYWLNPVISIALLLITYHLVTIML